MPEPLGRAAIEEGLEPLAITFDHAQLAGQLPQHHRDPLDRTLVAQARLQGLTIVTRDPSFDHHAVPVLRC